MNDNFVPIIMLALMGIAGYFLIFRQPSAPDSQDTSGGWGPWYMTYNTKPPGYINNAALYPLADYPMNG